MKDGPPLVLGLQVDEILRIAESSRVGSIVGRPGLGDDLCDLGEGGEDIAGLLGETRSFRLAYAVGHRSTRPDGAFVQMGQKLRANDPTEIQVKSDGERRHANADDNHPIIDSPAQAGPVASGEKNQDRIVPLLDAIAKEDRAKHRCDQNRERHGAE